MGRITQAMRDKEWNLICVEKALDELETMGDEKLNDLLYDDYSCAKYHLKRLAEKLQNES